MTDHEPTTNNNPQDGSSVVLEEVLRIRYRVRFGKVGLLRWTSHRDLARLWERVVRRAALPLSMTEGFHPKPRISFPSALALGVEGFNEVVELDLCQVLTPAELFEALRADNQPGLIIHSVQKLPQQSGKARLLRSDYSITIPSNTDMDAARCSIESFKKQETVSIERKRKKVTAHIESQIPVLEISETDQSDASDLNKMTSQACSAGTESPLPNSLAPEAGDDLDSMVMPNAFLHLSLMASDAASLKPNDILDLLEFDTWIPNGSTITRTCVQLEREFETNDANLIVGANAVDTTAIAPTMESAS